MYVVVVVVVITVIAGWFTIIGMSIGLEGTRWILYLNMRKIGENFSSWDFIFILFYFKFDLNKIDQGGSTLILCWLDWQKRGWVGLFVCFFLYRVGQTSFHYHSFFNRYTFFLLLTHLIKHHQHLHHQLLQVIQFNLNIIITVNYQSFLFE